MGCLKAISGQKRHRLCDLRGIMTAMVTPFKDDRLDENGFVFLCQRQIERGVAALVPCGTTGEASTLTHGEQMRLIELAVKTSDGRVPVIAGAGANCTRTAIELVQEAERLGADAILSVVPYYNRPTQEGLYQHFKMVQSATELPVLLYDVPSRTGASLTIDTLERLSDLPNIVGLKDASGDFDRAKKLRRLLGTDFLLLCGDDARFPDYLALGSEGCISVASNVAPALCASLYRAWESNDLGRFQHLRTLLGVLNEALFVETNPIPVKWALARLGLMGDDLRLPLTPLAQKCQPLVLRALNTVIDAEAEEATLFAASSRGRQGVAA
jgi:4-hydroxy-tetrahydrodipicolinate synthase